MQSTVCAFSMFNKFDTFRFSSESESEMSVPKPNDALTEVERSKLLQAAKEVAANAYAKYSNFRVGAAVLGRKEIYLGVNVENASYGLAVCAERAALAAAMAAGEKNIRAIAVASLDASTDETKMPCGACRQWIQELAPAAEVLIAGHEKPLRIEELLPRPFQVAN
jgi:cytidine deaminase